MNKIFTHRARNVFDCETLVKGIDLKALFSMGSNFVSLLKSRLLKRKNGKKLLSSFRFFQKG